MSSNEVVIQKPLFNPDSAPIANVRKRVGEAAARDDNLNLGMISGNAFHYVRCPQLPAQNVAGPTCIDKKCNVLKSLKHLAGQSNRIGNSAIFYANDQTPVEVIHMASLSLELHYLATANPQNGNGLGNTRNCVVVVCEAISTNKQLIKLVGCRELAPRVTFCSVKIKSEPAITQCFANFLPSPIKMLCVRPWSGDY